MSTPSEPSAPRDQPGPARTRVAPSPTGDPHVGTAYMALFDVAWARHTGGRFVLRIEDTDRVRLVEGSEQQIYDSLEWLGPRPRRGPRIRRAVRPLPSVGTPRHLPAIRRAVDRRRPCLLLLVFGRTPGGDARRAAAGQVGERLRPAVLRQDPRRAGAVARVHRHTRREDADPRRRAARLRRPHPGRGEGSASRRPGDPQGRRATPPTTSRWSSTITRWASPPWCAGEEWISSTPKHILLYRWLGLEVPQFAHMPLLRNTDKSKISKRRNPAARLSLVP